MRAGDIGLDVVPETDFATPPFDVNKSELIPGAMRRALCGLMSHEGVNEGVNGVAPMIIGAGYGKGFALVFRSPFAGDILLGERLCSSSSSIEMFSTEVPFMC